MSPARPLSRRLSQSVAVALLTALTATLLTLGTPSSTAATAATASSSASAGSGQGRGLTLRLAFPRHPLASRVTQGHPGRKGQPLFRHTEMPDPTGFAYQGRYVAIGTGSLAPRSIATSVAGPWRDRGSALKRLPRWATGRNIWASDIVQVKKHKFLLYFAAPAGGLGPLGRCIGVAVASSPLKKFRPKRRPITCPRAAHTPLASDKIRPPSPSKEAAGVIDPEGYQARNGARYLLYRTQGTPSSIRMVRLTRDGLRARKGGRARVLAFARGVIENPVLVQQRKGWVLITSQGYYGDCNYRTTWRRAPTLQGLKKVRSRALVTRASTRLCGPGGADVVHGSLLFFHAWTCRERACPHSDLQRAPRYGAQRSLFAAKLRWDRRGRPHLGRFVKPSKGTKQRPPGHQQPSPEPEPDDPGPLLPLPLGLREG